MNKRFSICLFLLMALSVPQAAYSWGNRGHSVIDRTAVDALPADGPVFLKKYVDYVAGAASLPDSWRETSEPFTKIEEDPNHGWFREQFQFMTTIPRSRYEFVLALYREQLRIEKTDPETARRMNVRWTGTLPYAAIEVYGRLVADMRELRKARAKGKDTAALEQSCAFYVAWMGHYIGDGSMPLHNTIHHDGWQGPNPKGYTRDPKIHSRFESQYVEAIGLTEKDIIDRLGAPGHLEGDVFDLILAHVDESGSNVEAIYKLDKRNAFADKQDAEAREMVYSRVAAGARMLRDLVYRAWLESNLPTRHIPDPAEPTTTGYNQETGSAPAAQSPSVDREIHR
jgi:hypothetical protein